MEKRESTPEHGTPPSQRDEFFLAAQWRLIENGPAAIQQAARELRGVSAVLPGLYFAAIQLGQLTPLLPTAWRLLLLVPYLLWLPAFGCAWRVFRPAACLSGTDATRQGRTVEPGVARVLVFQSEQTPARIMEEMERRLRFWALEEEDSTKADRLRRLARGLSSEGGLGEKAAGIGCGRRAWPPSPS